MEREVRYVRGIEIRQSSGGPPVLSGYAAVFNSPSVNLGHFVETIRPGAFRSSLSSRRPIFAFLDHDPGKVLARSDIAGGERGSLTLTEDGHGLRIEMAPLLNDTDGQNAIERVRAGLLDSMSFGFTVTDAGQKWDTSAKPARRELLDVALHEVSIVAFPAYPDTEIAMRSLASRQGPSLADRQAAMEARAAAWTR